MIERHKCQDIRACSGIRLVIQTDHRVLALHPNRVFRAGRKVGNLLPLSSDRRRGERLVGLEVGTCIPAFSESAMLFLA